MTEEHTYSVPGADDAADEPGADDNVTVLPVLTPPGGRLRAAREAKGLGLGQVVEALRVELKLVEAMEANRFEAFDAPVYARGFLRKYAQYLGLSPEDMIAELDGLAQVPSAPTHVPLTTAAPKFRDWSRINFAFGVVAAAVIVLGSFWWWHGRGAARDAPALPVAAPSGTASANEPTAQPAATAVADTAANPAPPSVGEAGDVSPVAPAPARAPVDGSPGAPEPPATSVVAAAAALADTAPSADRASTHLDLDFRGDSWVEVYAPDNTRKVYGLLRSGDHRTVPGAGPWRVLLGKADHVRVTLNGQELVPGPEQRKGETAYYRVDARGKLF